MVDFPLGFSAVFTFLCEAAELIPMFRHVFISTFVCSVNNVQQKLDIWGQLLSSIPLFLHLKICDRVASSGCFKQIYTVYKYIEGDGYETYGHISVWPTKCKRKIIIITKRCHLLSTASMTRCPRIYNTSLLYTSLEVDKSDSKFSNLTQSNVAQLN